MGKMLNIINLTGLLNINCRGAIVWSVYFVLFCFVLFLTFFHFLTDLKYTGRLIAGSLSAFSSKIINPQVSYRHPLILFFSIFFSAGLLVTLQKELKNT